MGNVTGRVLFFGLLLPCWPSPQAEFYALAAGKPGKYLKTNTYYLKLEAYISGTIYIFPGVLTFMMQPASASKK
ncbi:hypothetical protein ACFOTA_19915 [Chitinophaga sp. GCM10012297]|uniref:Uncharacterized protein n=1 Tax=Chitinophaga chungangae TaxID=2821488 RepID=A0ABS3YIH8_9BACT|nr:hypothetical protein [Chitinophaga chungangae]MBO9154491.1 hypothetical protein [Chitinophaga chungangae]